MQDCLQVVEDIAELGLRHIGFKDVGVPPDVLAELHSAIRQTGATTYLEVVSTTPQDALNSARVARDLGVDRLLGGNQVDEILTILAGSATTYHPFPGRPTGHPTKLGGSSEDVERDCRAFMKAGCAGADLLAYRATEADPVELIRAARRGLGSGYLIVAGSVASMQRVQEVRAAGADAFTIGSAIFDGSYSADKGSIRSQLADVLQHSAA